MNPLQLLTNQGAATALDLIAGAALKDGLMVLITYAVIRLWRRSSAAARHWLWLLTLFGILALPVVGLIGPVWRMSILPVASPNQSSASSTGLPFGFASGLSSNSTANLASSLALTKGIATSASSSEAGPNLTGVSPRVTALNNSSLLAPALPIPWARIGILFWLFGVLFTLNRWLGQWREIRQITSSGMPITDPGWQAMANDLATHYGIQRRVRLISSNRVAVPMTWGAWSPTILLPREASCWPLARQRVVLLHELAHIARRDYLTQWFTLVTCAFYWFNPAIWLTARQIALECERASDDHVLKAGIKNTEYATHLLEIACTARRTRMNGALGLALVRRSALTPRITSILSPHLSRGTLLYQHRLVLIALIALTLWPLSTMQLAPVSAQATPQPTVLTIALPTNIKDAFNDSMLKDFKAANPGIEVYVTDTQNVASAAFGVDAHLAGLQKYVSSADVLFIGDYQDQQVTAQATRAGYFLDLTPLVSADTSLKVDDFVPAMWRSFQWDNGIWALPVAGNLYTLLYKPAAFDKAGLTYPVNSWTAADFLNTVTKLTVKDAQGQIITPGFATNGGFSRAVMMRALAGANLFDTSSVPNPPSLDQPNVEAALNTFSQMQAQGLIGGDPQAAPMSILPATFTLFRPGDDKYVAALLPGGTAYLDTNAFAVSAGTQHPDAAYALIKFLTQRPEFAGTGGLAARRNLTGLAPVIKFPADVQAIIDLGLTHAITGADMRFADYLRIADNNIGGATNAQTAIQNAQSQAINDANVAAAKKGTLVLDIKEPTIAAAPAGKITLNFDMATNQSPLPTQAQWDQFTADFVSHDPLVAKVNVTVSTHSATQAASHSDCFYLGYNAVPDLNESSVLNLDPYLSTDAAFDKSDISSAVLSALQRDNKIWAMPLTVSPLALVYDADKFKVANVPAPTNDWTLSAFVDALSHLKAIGNPNDPTQTAPFVGAGDGTPLLALIADYGGLPIDYRTSPATINFTDPKNATAIRQALDLVKNGQISYGALGNLFGGNGGPNWNQTTALFNFSLNALQSLKSNPKGRSLLFKNTQLALFPVGQELTGTAFDVGATYISAAAQNPDACYRFIRALTEHPELFWNMPARTSVLNGPLYKSITDTDTLALYKQFAARLNSPHTVSFPASVQESNAVSVLFPQHWLFEAFDTYALHNGDLDAALALAEQQAKGYLNCIANLPPLNINDVGPTNLSAVKPYAQCAATMEPALKAQLTPLLGS